MLGLNFTRICWNKLNAQLLRNNRTYLSDAYKCTEVWKSRFNSPVFQKVRLEDLYMAIDKNLQQEEPVSAIDIDIFANSIKDEGYLSELRDILHKYRLTKETCTTLDSTHYAVIRNFIETKNYSELYEILDDRLNYGIFLDEFSANILLNDLIKAGDFELGAKYASLLMLQENFENKISANLALYACIRYLLTLQPEPVLEKVEEKPAPKKKKVEEIKVRVRFLRNEFFDDHFDIHDIMLLTGKTLTMISNKNNALDLNCQLLGWLFYKKFDKLKEVAALICKGKNLFKDTLQIVKTALETMHIRGDPLALEAGQSLLAELEALPVQDVSLQKSVEENINQALIQSQEEDIHRHSQLFNMWETQRETLLKVQLTRLQEAKVLKEREEKRETLRKLDEKIALLENEDKVDLIIENKKVFYRKRWFDKKKKAHVVDEGYIPPEVKARKSSPSSF